MVKAQEKTIDIFEPRDHQMETIAGHNLQKNLILRFVQKGEIPHAMLFHGPVGIGKKSFAYAVAKYINCTGQKGKAGCQCNSCHKIGHEIYLDLTVLKPEDFARVIKIEKIRKLQDSAYMTPTEATKKCALFFDAERMSLGAANSLLNILEEPPPHLLLILTTTNPHNLLPTIRSRCMSFRFFPLPTRDLKTWLHETIKIEEPLAEVAAILSEGRPGPALEMVQGNFFKRREEMIKELALFERHGFAAIFRVSEKIFAGSGTLGSSLHDLLVWHRDLLVNRLAPDNLSLLVNRDLASEIETHASRFSTPGLFEAYRAILDKQPLAQRMITPQLALLVLLNEIGSSLKKS